MSAETASSVYTSRLNSPGGRHKKSTFDPSKLETSVTVLFDSSNAASTHEIEFLKSKNTDGQLELVGLSASADRAAPYGASVEAVKQRLHACDASGQASVAAGLLYPLTLPGRAFRRNLKRNYEESIRGSTENQPSRVLHYSVYRIYDLSAHGGLGSWSR